MGAQYKPDGNMWLQLTQHSIKMPVQPLAISLQLCIRNSSEENHHLSGREEKKRDLGLLGNCLHRVIEVTYTISTPVC